MALIQKNTARFEFDSVADVQATAKSGFKDDQIAYIKGILSTNNDGSGNFRYDASSSAADDGATIIEPTGTGTGRFLRVFGETVSVKDFGADPTKATSSSAAIQLAVDSGAGAIGFPDGDYGFTEPVLIKNGTARVSLRSNSRIRTTLGTMALTTIATAPQNLNAIFIIQDNNAHFCMENFYFSNPGAGYTGVGVYCKEGGGDDASGQALFSAMFKNIWVALPSTNGGFLQGGLQNCTFDTFTVEAAKSVFLLEGAGNGDVFFRNFSLSMNYDSFITQVADTVGAERITVDGVHAYSHYRGRLFDVQNWTDCRISNVSLDPITTGNLGDIGLFKFNDCTGISVNNFDAGLHTTKANVGIEITGATQAKFTTGHIKSNVGLLFSDTGLVDVEFDGVDFSECDTAAIQFTANTTGTIRTRNCKFGNCGLTGVLFQAAASVNWYSTDDEFVNAGIGTSGSAANRNLDLFSSGDIVLTRPRIGQDDAAADAGYYVQAGGAGALSIINPTWVGTPVTGYFTGAQSPVIEVTPARATITYSTSMSLNALLVTEGVITATDGVGFTISNPTNPFAEMKIQYTIRNTSGGALGALTLGAAFKAAAWTQPANGFSRSISFQYDGTNWIETSRTTADIPN